MWATTPWIPVGELAQSFSRANNSSPLTADLVGKTMTLCFADARVIAYDLPTDQQLAWKMVSGHGKGSSGTNSYSARKIREGIYFVDYVQDSERASTTLLVDFNRGLFTAVIGHLPAEAEVRRDFVTRVETGEELTSVKASFIGGAIDQPFTAQTPRHETTDEMIGHRVEYTYSAMECYEHVYLNENFYTWHCLRGGEKGLADTDRCHYYKLGDKLYLFVWREKIVPTLGVVAVDFAEMRSTGKIFGYEGNDFRRVVNFRVGAKAQLLNVTNRLRE